MKSSTLPSSCCLSLSSVFLDSISARNCLCGPNWKSFSSCAMWPTRGGEENPKVVYRCDWNDDEEFRGRGWRGSFWFISAITLGQEANNRKAVLFQLFLLLDFGDDCACGSKRRETFYCWWIHVIFVAVMFWDNIFPGEQNDTASFCVVTNSSDSFCWANKNSLWMVNVYFYVNWKMVGECLEINFLISENAIQITTVISGKSKLQSKENQFTLRHL